MINKGFKLGLYFILFLLVGELLVRLDREFDVLDNSPKKIAIQVDESTLLSEVDSGLFLPKEGELRVMVIGDSYIHGGGINKKYKFARVLDSFLDAQAVNQKVQVLDISRPSNNTQDNFNSFSYYLPRFKPHYVIWAYNFNDILGPISGIQHKSENAQKEALEPPKKLAKDSKGLKKYILKVYKHSELIAYASALIQKELKVNGIVLPVGDFYNLTHSTYSPSSEKWILSQEMLREAAYQCDSIGSKFILYQLPEFNLLEKHKLFAGIDDALKSFADSNQSIQFKNGYFDFNKGKGSQFMISKYDGHPNESAHARMAEVLGLHIIKEQKKRINN